MNWNHPQFIHQHFQKRPIRPGVKGNDNDMQVT
jgi:3-hydroxymyristoyl/3-hydroxydecanoyl-(acyl carrier protein) dehydratase